jgi:hypothetical protein
MEPCRSLGKTELQALVIGSPPRRPAAAAAGRRQDGGIDDAEGGRTQSKLVDQPHREECISATTRSDVVPDPIARDKVVACIVAEPIQVLHLDLATTTR